jgi:hypothetical protein
MQNNLEETEKAIALRKRGANSRSKGLKFENEVATKLAHIFPDACRHLEFQKQKAAKKMDIENTGPWIIQCKNKQKYENPKTLHETQTKEGEYPVLVTKGFKQPPLAVIPFEVLVMLIEIAHGHRAPFKTLEEFTSRKEKTIVKSLPPFNNSEDKKELFL